MQCKSKIKKRKKKETTQQQRENAEYIYDISPICFII